jgi:hypothetical protein
MRSEIDHLVVACATLAQGATWAAERLGVEPQVGGRHDAMGTHNLLLRLGRRLYLELIALDPAGATPARPRWFGLDQPDVQARAARQPFLVNWVAATDDIHEAVARVPVLGAVQVLTRGSYAWRFALPDDGRLNHDGVLPSLIQWDSAHPAEQMDDRGCHLQGLDLAHPQAAQLLALFRVLRIAGPVNLTTGPVSLRARLLSPRGAVELA